MNEALDTTGGSTDGAADAPATADGRGDPAIAVTTFGVLRRPNMRFMFLGNMTSNIGTWFQNIAGAAIMFDLTGSSLWVGAVNFALFSGALLLAPWTGSVADRFDRRLVMVTTETSAAVVAGVLALLTATGRLDEWVLLGGSALLGLSLAFKAPSMLALVPLLVEDAELEPAVSLNSVSFNIGRAVGPVLGAVVLASLGAAWAFGLNAVTFVVFAVFLLLLHPRPQARSPARRPRLRDSVHMVRDDARLSQLLVAVGLISLTTDPVYTLTAELAQSVFEGSKATIGYLVGAFGVGATVTAFVGLPVVARLRHPVAGSMVAQGLGIGLLAVAPSLGVALIGLAISGAGFLAGLTQVTTHLQTAVATENQGRVMALWTLMFAGSRPISALIDGGIADVFGPRPAALVFALPALVGARLMLRLGGPGR